VKTKSRKEVRKDKRQQKKINRFTYHRSKKNQKDGKARNGKQKSEKDAGSDSEEFEDDDEEIESDFSGEDEQETNVSAPAKAEKQDKFERHIAREKQEEKEYYDEIKKNRVVQLKEQNEEEDKIISKYEKLLKLNKRKKKNGSDSTSKFTDGLDYLLELCTDDSIQKMYSAAKEVEEAQEQSGDDDFEEDLNLALGKSKEKKKKKSKEPESEVPSKDVAKMKKRAEKMKEVEKKYFGDDEDYFKNFDVDSCEGSDSELESNDDDLMDTEDEEMLESDDEAPDEVPTISKGKKGKSVKFQEEPKAKKAKKLSDSEDSEFDIEDDSGDEEAMSEDCEMESNDGASENDGNGSESNENDSEFGEENSEAASEPEEPKEDIYGRKRDKDGNIIKDPATKYIPPHMRNKLSSLDTEDDPKRREKLQNLKRQIKGQINRLAESNLHRITIDIENLYGVNARHDVNTTLTEVITDSLVSHTLAVERLVLEHTVLIATLHANIGSEIGAFFLQIIVERFDAMFKRIDEMNVENKELDNLIFIICHLYTYRLFKHNLIYEMLDKLCEKMTEKRIECMLLVLRSIGFVLRKDDPLMLKQFITKVQKLANTAGDETEKNTRVMFMLDILMAVKNNNVSKIPQYDSSLVEHFRKLLKQFVRAGKYVTTLAVTMEDLLKADECGKWWLVGSAWAGNEKNERDDKKNVQDTAGDEQRQKIFALAKKQRMNTDDKRNIFYILMTAEDYLEAFEKIVSSVKDDRSIVAVILHCCLSEKEYNPYYSVIAQKFCDHNRKFLLAIQFTIWDKIKDINSLSIKQVSNLARFLIFLVENGSLPLSVLKVIEFNQIEKTTLRFLRQVMLGLLLIKEEKFHEIFDRIQPSAKLNPFKDQLRLFMKVFLIKDEKKITISDDQMSKLKERMRLADKFLMVKHY
jgi:nucleolar MIF4G domain-containing protein 1